MPPGPCAAQEEGDPGGQEGEQRLPLLTLAAGPLPTLWAAGCPFLLLHVAASCIPGIVRSSLPLPGRGGAELGEGHGVHKMLGLDTH